MYDGKFNPSETSEERANINVEIPGERISSFQCHLPQFSSLIFDRDTNMHCLHAQDLIITLLIIKHRRSKVIKDVLGGQRTVGLCRIIRGLTKGGDYFKTHYLYPFVPNEESMAVVVCRMKVVDVHKIEPVRL